MAPMAPLGRKRAIECVVKGQLPLQFGSPHPFICVVEQDGVFRIRTLVVDPAEADAARARGSSFMPEHYYALGRPTGEIFVEAASRAELVARMKTMPWPDDW